MVEEGKVVSTTYDKLKDILIALGVENEKICESSVVGLYNDSDIGLSSLDKIQFVVAVEEQFQIEIDMTSELLVSVQDYVDYIEESYK